MAHDITQTDPDAISPQSNWSSDARYDQDDEADDVYHVTDDGRHGLSNGGMSWYLYGDDYYLRSRSSNVDKQTPHHGQATCTSCETKMRRRDYRSEKVASISSLLFFIFINLL